MDGLIASAGGDPWAIADSPQAGSPTQINFLAQAFHSAAGSSTAAEETFRTAQQHFEQYDRENGEQPINNGAEVQRVKEGLHATNAQLGQIAADLETVAAALAQARAAAQANITALNANLKALDARIGYYLEFENQGHDCDAEINQCTRQAKDDTATALHNATVIRSTYSSTLQQALTNLRVKDGYRPAAEVRKFDGDTFSERMRNQAQAFENAYGRQPASQNDWRMAEALDPHSYDPKNFGVPPQIVAGRFQPMPGRGVVRTNMFIPTDQVVNTFKDGTDIANGRLLPRNLGDNRGPSAAADIEASRVSMFIDYDHGLIVVRQNPTVNTDGQRGGAAAGIPNVHVIQSPDGRMTVDYAAQDAYENPFGTAAGITVNGRVTFSPQPNGAIRLGGTSTIYPSMETYQYRDGLAPQQLQWNPANSGSQWGPATSLPRHHWVGDATIPYVRPDMPDWKWELENALPFVQDPFITHTQQLIDPADYIPTVSVGR
ncbi:putative alpha/beta hydrolase [Mycolicibacter icosiumassiliensis]|uniref:putative alpha/beta hydrolase n=1 Tax=Mycolicibacter icosiumassiliensis TaxID=1792835 RepID=UPI000A584FAF|nr:hypothetical protein [Mycolicibacter icosiumassiliensis]